jgi:hypothetical protein
MDAPVIRPAPITTMALIIFAIVRMAPAPTVADTGKPFAHTSASKSAPVASAPVPAPVVDEWAAYIPKLAPVPPRRPKPAKPRTRAKPRPIPHMRPVPIGRAPVPVSFTLSISIR